MKLLVYNLWLTCLSPRVPPNKLERIEGFIDNLKEHHQQHSTEEDFDLIALQEVFTFGGFGLFSGFTFNSELKQLIMKELQKFGYCCCVQSDQPKIFMQDSGLMIFTKHQVLESENYIFQYASYTEYIVAKGILYALIKHKEKDQYLIVLSIHHDAHSEKSRREQIKEVLKFTKEKIETIKDNRSEMIRFGENVRIVICGDYNVDSLHSNESYTYLKDQMSSVLGLRNVFGEDTTNHPITYPIPRFNNWCLDHVFVSDFDKCQHSFEVMKWKSTNDKIDISDHYGVMGKIEY